MVLIKYFLITNRITFLNNFHMNLIDIVVIALLIIAAIWGIWKGFISQLISIVGVLLGIWGASKLTPFVYSMLIGSADNPNSANTVKIITFAVLVILIIIICHLIGKLLDKVTNMTILGGVNRVLGALFSVLKVMLILIVIVSLINNGLLSTEFEVPDIVKSSYSYQYLNQAADIIIPFVKDIFSGLQQ